MTAKHLVQVDSDLIEAIAFKYGLSVERSNDEQRMYVVLEGVEYYAPSLNEVCS